MGLKHDLVCTLFYCTKIESGRCCRVCKHHPDNGGKCVKACLNCPDICGYSKEEALYRYANSQTK